MADRFFVQYVPDGTQVEPNVEDNVVTAPQRSSTLIVGAPPYDYEEVDETQYRDVVDKGVLYPQGTKPKYRFKRTGVGQITEQVDDRPVLTITITPTVANVNDIVNFQLLGTDHLGNPIPGTKTKSVGWRRGNESAESRRVTFVNGVFSRDKTFGKSGRWEFFSVGDYRIEGDTSVVIEEDF